MRIESMREYLAVAKTKNITAASEQIYVAQPVLSKHLKALEDELGAPLLIRTSRGVELTPLGEEAARVFEEVVDLVDGFTKLARDEDAHAKELLHIGMLNLGFERYIAPFVLEAKASRPDFHVQYTNQKPSEILRDIDKDKLDIGFFAGEPQSLNDSLDSIRIGSELVLIAISKDHPCSGMKALTPECLSQDPLICLRNKDTTPYMNSLLFAAGIKPSQIIEVDEVEVAPFYIEQTRGFFAISEFMADAFTMHRNLVVLPMKDPIQSSIRFVYKRENTNPALKTFLDIVRSH